MTRAKMMTLIRRLLFVTLLITTQQQINGKYVAVAAFTTTNKSFSSILSHHGWNSKIQQHKSLTSIIPSTTTTTDTCLASSTWSEIESRIGESFHQPAPISIDSVFDDTNPATLSDNNGQRPIFFRERHGWCPYSERVWLALDLCGVEYDTVRIDNTGGPRPSYYSGQTPQMKWPDISRRQGESMDLVYEIDKRYGQNMLQSTSPTVLDIVKQFQSIFPRARPSSRAAFLFQYNGEPLWKSVFEQTLAETDELLKSGSGDGPFFDGSECITAADIAWAPFLERYRYQLPCLHDGLDPADGSVYPNLSRWYDAMDKLPVYACRIKGDASSWRKVLSMAGFGNSGIPPDVQRNVDSLREREEREALECQNLDVWDTYASGRSWVASTPKMEVASIVTKNRKAIITDMVKQSQKSSSPWKGRGLPDADELADKTLRQLCTRLLKSDDDDEGDEEEEEESVEVLSTVTTFLDDRMCVPRDMGSMPAGVIKNLSVSLRDRKITTNQ